MQPSRLQPGIDLFNRQDFYACHDSIEEIWLEESSDQQPFLQGLIQSAVAFYHYQQGKRGAARTMLRMAIAKLQDYPSPYLGIDLETLLHQLRAWKSALDEAVSEGGPVEPQLSYPRIRKPPSQV